MPSRSHSDRPSSTDWLGSRRLAALASLAVLLTAVAVAVAERVLPGPLAPPFAGGVVILVVGTGAMAVLRREHSRLQASERWHRRLRAELVSQGSFLDELVASLDAVSSSLEVSRVLEATAEQAHALLRPDATVMLVSDPSRPSLRPAVARGLALPPLLTLEVDPASAGSLIGEVARSGRVACANPPEPAPGDGLIAHLQPAAALALPLQAMGDLQAVLCLLRLQEGRFGPADVSQAMAYADLASRALENALLFERVEALLGQARIREAERAELSRRVVTAEQDERRRLSLFLHDGPLQTMSGIAMMLDAAVEDLQGGNLADATRVVSQALERQRGVVRSIRELSFALEPWVLRDRGFVAAAGALADEFERNHDVRFELDIDAAAGLDPDDQVCLYQIVREAVQNAIKHARPSRIHVSVTDSGLPGGFRLHVRDDGAGFADGPDDDLPHHGLASMRERASILGGDLHIHSVPGAGTTVSLDVPATAGGVNAA
jgi:signal transduction histidine kinase